MTPKIPRIPVQIGGGIVVLHTREEYRRLMTDVDKLASDQMNKPIPKEKD